MMGTDDDSSSGMPLAEVYKIIYEGPLDDIPGFIWSIDNCNGRQCLFKNMPTEEDDSLEFDRTCGEDKPITNYTNEVCYSKPLNRFEVILKGPNKSSIVVFRDFELVFNLLDCGSYHYMYHPYPMGADESYSTPLCQEIRTFDGNHLFRVFYGVFEYAAEARVNVKLTNIKSGSNIYGSIYASTTAIMDPMYQSLLFFKDNGDWVVEHGAEEPIQLFRSLVAVPLESDLILQICLSGGEDNRIVPITLVFNCVEGLPSDCRKISCSYWDIEVDICWRYECKSSSEDNSP